MAPVPTAPLPGGMTVPPLFGWEQILVVVVLAVVVAAAFLLFMSNGGAANERSEWQAWLDARPSRRRDE